MTIRKQIEVILGTARERLGMGAVALGVVVAAGAVAFGGFAGCQKREVPAKVAQFPVAVATTPSPDASRERPPHSESGIVVYVTGAVKRPGVYTLRNDARLYHAIRAAGGFKANAVTDALNLADRAQDGDHLCIPAAQKPPKRFANQPNMPRRTLESVSPHPLLIRKTTLPAPVVLPPLAQTPPMPLAIATAAPGRVLGTPSIEIPPPPPNTPAEATRTAPLPTGEGTIRFPNTGQKTERSSSRTGTKFKNPGDGVVSLNTATAAQLEQLPRCGPAMSGKILAYRAQIGRFTDLKQLMDVKGVGEKTFAKWQPFLTL